MAWPFDAEDTAAIDRLESFYNGDAYDADTNPGGFAVGGHRINFEDSLQDVARAAEAIAAAAEAAAVDATAAGVSETNAAASAAKLIGSSTTSLAIGAGSKAFTTQADKSFAVGTFLLIVSAANPTVNYMAGQVTAYSGTSLTVNVTVTLGSGAFSDWTIAVAGSPGAQGTTGATGATGPTPDVQFSFSTGVTDSDPGNGLIKLNNAAAASATQIYVDDLERNGNSITSWVDAFDDSTNTALRGQIVMVQISDPTKFAIFNVTGAVTVGGVGTYRKIPIAFVAGPGGFTNAAVIAVRFSRTGDKGADGDGAGDVVGPASATDGHFALFDGTTGNLLKGGGAPALVATSGAAEDVAFTPAGNIAATNLQDALEELDAEKATPADVTAAINALVAAAPGALDTLDELAAALGDDANFAATVTTALAGKQPLSATLTAIAADAPAGVGVIPMPGGRLTLTSGTPVLTATVSAATAIYFSPYLHNGLPLYTGTVWTWRTFAEMTLTLDATGHVTNSNYDVFAFDDTGTLRIGTGPAWTSDTARGTGAGTTQLAKLNGRETNAVSITLRNNSVNYSSIGVGRALYLGSFRTGSAGQVNFILGGNSAGGTAAILGLWNMYNRRLFNPRVTDSTANWPYSTNTVRPLNNSLGNRISFICGLAEDAVEATIHVGCYTDASNRVGSAGVALDATNVINFPRSLIVGVSTAMQAALLATYRPGSQLGFHFFQAVENANSGAQVTFYGGEDQAFTGEWWG